MDPTTTATRLRMVSTRSTTPASCTRRSRRTAGAGGSCADRSAAETAAIGRVVPIVPALAALAVAVPAAAALAAAALAAAAVAADPPPAWRIETSGGGSSGGSVRPIRPATSSADSTVVGALRSAGRWVGRPARRRTTWIPIER